MWPSLGDAVTASFATEYDEQADDDKAIEIEECELVPREVKPVKG